MIHYLHNLAPWDWFGFAIILLALEFFIATTGFLVWLALIATIVGVLLWLFPAIPWPYQLLIFSLTGIICSVSWWAYLLRHPSQAKIRNELANQYLNRIFMLERPIIHGKGLLYIDSLAWRITGPDLPVGAQVRIIGVNKTVLEVEKVL